MTKYLIGALLALLIGTANATQTNSGTICNGNGSCGTTNNVTNQGGQGGQGGNAFATGGAGGNATIQAGAVKVDNKNTNTNLNSNTNVNANTNINSNKQGQAQGQMQGQGQGQTQSNSAIGSGNTTTVTVEDKRQAVPAASVTAAGTTALCRIAGGVSVGGVWGGASIAGSVEDENCAAIEAAKAAIWAGASTGDTGLTKRGVAVLSENLKRFEKKAEETKTSATTTEYGAGYAARTVSFESFTQ